MRTPGNPVLRRNPRRPQSKPLRRPPRSGANRGNRRASQRISIICDHRRLRWQRLGVRDWPKAWEPCWAPMSRGWGVPGGSPPTAGAAVAEPPVAEKIGPSLRVLPLSVIEANPLQPRQDFDQETLVELSDSIKQSGLIQPLVVRHTGDKYQLIAGERRLRACKLGRLDRRALHRQHCRRRAQPDHGPRGEPPARGSQCH